MSIAICTFKKKYGKRKCYTDMNKSFSLWEAFTAISIKRSPVRGNWSRGTGGRSTTFARDLIALKLRSKSTTRGSLRGTLSR